MSRTSSWHLLAILVFTLFLGFIDLPESWQSKILPSVPNFIKEMKVNLGLDLRGGAQLDYKIDLRKIEKNEQSGAIDSVQQVIERRVNALGVAEPNIYVSKVADEDHIVVELAGVDINTAKETVGKTIQLEFKEERAEVDPKTKEKVVAQAQDFLKKVQKDPTQFEKIGKEEETTFVGKVDFLDTQENYYFADQINESLIDPLSKLNPGQIYANPIDLKPSYVIDANGGLVEKVGVGILKLIDSKEEKRKPSFAILATKYSDEPGAKESQGALNAAVKKEGSSYVKPFVDGSFALEKEGDISKEPVESEFGYHLIKLDSIQSGKDGEELRLVSHILTAYKGASKADNSVTRTKEQALQKSKEILKELGTEKNEKKYRYQYAFFSTKPDMWQETGLTGKNFKRADLKRNQQTGEILIGIAFDPEGARLFEEITGRNVGKRVAIFVGGTMISSPQVREKIGGGEAVITGYNNIKAASELARDLNTGAIGAPLLLQGQYSISASLGDEALKTSLKAGIIGFITLALFMVIYYRFLGVISVIALSIYSIIVLFLIKGAFPLPVAIAVSTLIFIVLTYKIINSNESGWEKLVSFVVAVFSLFLISILLSTPITLTLAGVAGIVLSIGMAVDANILIFERMKEEFRSGKNLLSAVENGFDRAWSSIRDSNFSTLITCVILLWFGSSLIKGFALNLSMGVLVSMFTALTITKTMLKAFIGTKIGKSQFLFCANTKPLFEKINFIRYRRIFYVISGLLFIGSILYGTIFGLNLGRDFLGGSLLKWQMEKKPTIAELNQTIKETEDRLLKNFTNTPNSSAKTSFGTPNIVISDDGSYIIRLNSLTEEEHDTLKNDVSKKYGKIDEVSFSSIGPVIGATMREKSIYAIVVAAIMIMLYVAFAFRYVPREVNPWRFGVATLVALVHDLTITTGFYLILSHFVAVEIDVLFVTAQLTILGYSVNDTIVVFDRIRENIKLKKNSTFEEIINSSVTQTMGRSINTSLTTIIPLLFMFFFGGESIKYFVLTLVFGITIGTYSSICIASALVYSWKKFREKHEKRRA